MPKIQKYQSLLTPRIDFHALRGHKTNSNGYTVATIVCSQNDAFTRLKYVRNIPLAMTTTVWQAPPAPDSCAGDTAALAGMLKAEVGSARGIGNSILSWREMLTL